MTIADSEPVQKVRKALKDAGRADSVVELDAPMKNAAETAKALDTEPGRGRPDDSLQPAGPPAAGPAPVSRLE